MTTEQCWLGYGKWVAMAAAGLFFTSCVNQGRNYPGSESVVRGQMVVGPGAGISEEEMSLLIDLSRQKGFLYHEGRAVSSFRVSTGREGFRTPPGTYRVLEKEKDKRSNLYGSIFDERGGVLHRDVDLREKVLPPGGYFLGASMPYWMRLTDTGIGLHAGPIPSSGTPASHGCIRLPGRVAEQLFGIVPVDTLVRIVN